MCIALLLLSRISKHVTSTCEWSITIHLCGEALLFLPQTISSPGRCLSTGSYRSSGQALLFCSDTFRNYIQWLPKTLVLCVRTNLFFLTFCFYF